MTIDAMFGSGPRAGAVVPLLAALPGALVSAGAVAAGNGTTIIREVELG